MLPPQLPDPFDHVQDILDDVRELQAENFALDYVEQALGRLYFQENWERLPDEAHLRDIKSWLEETGRDVDYADDMVTELRRLYRVRARWPH